MSQILHDLFTTIESRKQNPPRGSYTSHLFIRGEDEILKKMGEEVIEVIVAAKGQGDERLVSEMADLFYHCLVLLSVRNLQLADIEAELVRRMK